MNEINQRASRFFPPSAYEFRGEIERLAVQIQEHATACAEIQARLDDVLKLGPELSAVRNETAKADVEIQAQLDDVLKLGPELSAVRNEAAKTAAEIQAQAQMFRVALEQLREGQRSLETRLDSIIGGISGLYQKDYPLNVEFERAYYRDFPVCSSPEAPEFQEDFLSLVHGLDAKSVETVVLALQRIRLIQKTTDSFVDLYSKEEKGMMRQLTEHFYSNILQLSEGKYFYKGYLLPVNHFEPCVFIDKCGLPYLEHPERLRERDIIDAGAFIGDSALVLSSLTNRRVYAFEPTPVNYEHMIQTIKMNGLNSVEPCPYALGGERGKITISISDSSSTQFENEAISYEGSVEVEMTTIDDFVHTHDLRLGLIKADIEGAESLMLQGAVETIKTQKPALLINIYHNANDFFKIKPWLEALDLGYKFKIRHPVGGTVMTETILIAEV
ncbi:MAG: FkbM family methyltransferase [Oscillibacter sp.]|nr:FkbM family methyltransferase [Oscillibacter sp.]